MSFVKASKQAKIVVSESIRDVVVLCSDVMGRCGVLYFSRMAVEDKLQRKTRDACHVVNRH